MIIIAAQLKKLLQAHQIRIQIVQAVKMIQLKIIVQIITLIMVQFKISLMIIIQVIQINILIAGIQLLV